MMTFEAQDLGSDLGVMAVLPSGYRMGIGTLPKSAVDNDEAFYGLALDLWHEVSSTWLAVSRESFTGSDGERYPIGTPFALVVAPSETGDGWGILWSDDRVEVPVPSEDFYRRAVGLAMMTVPFRIEAGDPVYPPGTEIVVLEAPDDLGFGIGVVVGDFRQFRFSQSEVMAR